MAHEIEISQIACQSGRVFPLNAEDAEQLMVAFDGLIKGTTEFMSYVKLYSTLASAYDAKVPMNTEGVEPTGPQCILCMKHLCPDCGKCENEACKLYGYTAITVQDLGPLRHLLAETQKARGYTALALASKEGSSNIHVPSPYHVVMEESDIAGIAGLGKSKLFVRPCPVRPRHGFVDSRVVEGTEEEMKRSIRDILIEARMEDSQAELILAPYIDAEYSAVITPTRVAYARGHDGATAGKKAVTVPLISTRPLELTDEILIKSGVKTATEDPYIEVVLGKDKSGGSNRLHVTQLRAGVKLPASLGADFIPAWMKVTTTVEASGNLVEWERQVLTLTPDTVVYHVGGTLISHYGVHCLTHKIPIMTSRRPVKGEVLEPVGRVTDPDPDAVRQGIGVGSLISLATTDQRYQCQTAVCMLLTVLHNAPAMGGDDGLWLGVASAMMHKLGMAAAHGESRHARGRGRLSRQQVYTEALKHHFRARTMLGVTYRLFMGGHSWGGGYGGPKWGACTDSVIRLDTAMRGVVNNPNAETAKELTDALNNSVNQAHNNGWWLNKYIETSAFDRAMKQSLTTLSAGAPIFVEAATLNQQSSKQVSIASVLEQWAAQGDITIPTHVRTETEVGKCVIEVDDPAVFIIPPKEGKDKEEEAVIAIKTTAAAAAAPTPIKKAVKKPSTVKVTAAPVTTPAALPIVAQGWYRDDGYLHVQYKNGGSGYKSFDAPVTTPTPFSAWLASHKKTNAGGFLQSYASETKKYVPLTVAANGDGSVEFTDPQSGISITRML